MIIGVAGPYSAPTAEQKKQIQDAMNKAAAEIFKLGHIPFIGINVSVPVVEQMSFKTEEERYAAIMKISLALIDQCDALLVIGESRGVQMEKELILKKGLKVYYHLSEIEKEI
jgi:hypothetical protein